MPVMSDKASRVIFYLNLPNEISEKISLNDGAKKMRGLKLLA